MTKFSSPRFKKTVTAYLNSPIYRFVWACISSGLANTIVYLVIRALAYAVESFDVVIPLEEEGAMILLRDGLNWAGAIAALSGFVIASVHQIGELRRELKNSNPTAGSINVN